VVALLMVWMRTYTRFNLPVRAQRRRNLAIERHWWATALI